MADFICPICDTPYPQDSRKCPLCAWPLERGYILGSVTPEQQAEYQKKVAAARQQWQALQAEKARQAEEQRRQQADALSRTGQAAVERGSQLLAEGHAQEAAAEFEKAIQSFYQQIRQAEADARYGYEHYLDDLKARYQQRLVEIDQQFAQRREQSQQEHQQALAQADQALQHSEQQAQNQMNELRSAFRWAVLPWNDPTWDGYEPAGNGPIPSAVRFGRLDAPDAAALGDLPAMVPLVGQGHLFIQGEDPALARQLLQSILLRLVVSTAPRSLQLTLVDPAGSGANLAAFLRLPDDVRGAKVFARPEEIAPRLDELIAHIEQVIQNHLLNIYPTLEDYNAQGGKIAVPYAFLVLADFPAGFNESMLQKLVNIARSGPKAGVYILGSLNPAFPAPQKFNLNELLNLGTVLRLNNQGRIDWDDPEFGKFQVIPDAMPEAYYSNSWMEKVAQKCSEPPIPITFQELVIREADRWLANATEGLRVPIGINGTGEIHFFEIGKGTLNFGLIGGMAQSGKTNLLHVIIIQLALAYSWQELELYLLDFKEGVEFADYWRNRIRHVQVLALHSEREFGLSALQRLQEIVEERGKLFKQAGVSRYDDYRRTTGQKLARILVVLDEYQVLFQEEDPLAREAERLLEDLTRRGASFGLHILFSTQSPTRGRSLSAATYDQIGLRIALKCYPEVARNILGENNRGVEQINNPGKAVYNDAMGYPDKNQYIQIAFLPPQDRPTYLNAIAALNKGAEYRDPVMFDPDAPAHLLTNSKLQAALGEPPQPAGQAAHLWLGEPLAIKDPTAAELERYAASNLLLLCDEESDAYGLLSAALFSLAAQRVPQEVAFTLLDFTRPTSPQVGWSGRVRQALPQYTINLPGARQTASALAGLCEELARRQADPAQNWPEHLLLIAGLNRWRELKPVAAQFGSKPSESAQKLILLATEGPENGIHILAWGEDMNAVNQAFDRGGLNLFDLRAALHLTEVDSNTFLGNAATASRLEGRRAVYRHESWKTGRVEKFKPYPLLDEADLAKLAEIFAKNRS